MVFLLAFGFFGVLGGKSLASFVMKSEMVLTNSFTSLFECWQDTANKKINIYRRYYFFNLTNPVQVYWDRVQPQYILMGPYWFATRRSRPLESIYWDTEDNINFRYHDYQVFLPEKSIDEITGLPLRLDDNVTNINMALFTAAWRDRSR